MADSESAAASSDAAPTPPPPTYVHKLSDHAVLGDGTFGEVNDRAARPYEGGVEGARDLPDLNAFLEAAEVKKKDEPDNTPLEPLPEIPGMPMTVDQAYDFLGVKKEDRGNLDKVKMRFRKMSLKWHPDKNLRRPKEAADVFTAVHAAYHFLTTNNFDYKRWAENFVIPPMQSLEDVLLMALKGADPYQIEMLLKKRGDYRPHAEFGINLSIPWSAGSKEDPNYHVHSGSVYTTTQGLEDKRRRELGYSAGAGGGGGGGAPEIGAGAIVTTTAGMDTQDLLEQFGKNAQVGADAEARPWEMVGGVGFDQKKKARAPVYVPPKTRPDLKPTDAEAPAVAEEFNDAAVRVCSTLRAPHSAREASSAPVVPAAARAATGRAERATRPPSFIPSAPLSLSLSLPLSVSPSPSLPLSLSPSFSLSLFPLSLSALPGGSLALIAPPA